MIALDAFSGLILQGGGVADSALAPQVQVAGSAAVLRLPGFDLDLTQVLFLALALSLVLAAIGWGLVAIAAGRRAGGAPRPERDELSDVRALVLQRGDGRAAVNADLVAAAGRGQGVVLGSGQKADVQLDGADLDESHARLTRDGGRLFLTNLGRAGAVAISDVPLTPNQPFPVHAGDRIRLGTVEYVARVE